jgi:hypothetical protein
MLLHHTICNLLLQETVLKENFTNPISNWEQVKNTAEQAFIKDGHYWMENKDTDRWKYYKHILPLKLEADCMIDTHIELMSTTDSGHYGLVWGFDDAREILNRFTVSADGKRFYIMQFQKDHHRVFHRFHTLLPNGIKDMVRLTIIKAQEYFYFLVNGILLYTCHQKQFACMGNNFGYYVEPGIFIRSNYIAVKRLLTKPAETSMAFEGILKEGIEMGSN